LAWDVGAVVEDAAVRWSSAGARHGLSETAVVGWVRDVGVAVCGWWFKGRVVPVLDWVSAMLIREGFLAGGWNVGGLLIRNMVSTWSLLLTAAALATPLSIQVGDANSMSPVKSLPIKIGGRSIVWSRG
jgi:hypothetical protein